MANTQISLSPEVIDWYKEKYKIDDLDFSLGIHIKKRILSEFYSQYPEHHANQKQAEVVYSRERTESGSATRVLDDIKCDSEEDDKSKQ